jgi:GT2 family glycosyltransferase
METPRNASVVIATRNRNEELRNAIESVLAQTIPAEVLVIDDGSTDATSEMVSSRFPQVRLIRHRKSRGYIARRNEGARLAAGDVVFSIDDDATFSSPCTLEHTLREFDNPRIGAIAIPHLDTLSERLVNAPAPDADVWCLAHYTGTSHAVRRSVFLQLGGYREEMVHQGEEGDFCLRLLAAGYVTRLGTAAPIQHHESPRRSLGQMEYFGRRNDVLQAWRHTPAAWLVLHLFATTVNGLRQAVRTRRPAAHVRGLASGLNMALTGRAERAPATKEIYWLFRQLKKRGPIRLTEFEQKLPLLSQR